MGKLLDVRGKRAFLTLGPDDEAACNAAITLASHGCRVVLTGDQDTLNQKAQRILASCSLIRPHDIQIVHLDLQDCNQQSVETAASAASQIWDGLDLLLISSSYTGPLTPFLDTSGQQLDEAVNKNFKHLCLISIAVAKRMQQSGIGGSIIFMTSIIGTERGLFPGVSVAGASIAAVNYLTRAMALELGKYKIRVNAIACGLQESDALLKPLSKDAVNKEGKRIVPLQRWVSGEKDLTAMILYLAADSSSFITGTVVFVDGGQSLVRPRMRSFL